YHVSRCLRHYRTAVTLSKDWRAAGLSHGCGNRGQQGKDSGRHAGAPISQRRTIVNGYPATVRRAARDRVWLRRHRNLLRLVVTHCYIFVDDLELEWFGHWCSPEGRPNKAQVIGSGEWLSPQTSSLSARSLVSLVSADLMSSCCTYSVMSFNPCCMRALFSKLSASIPY